jgi:hypothetical protein
MLLDMNIVAYQHPTNSDTYVKNVAKHYLTARDKRVKRAAHEVLLSLAPTTMVKLAYEEVTK